MTTLGIGGILFISFSFLLSTNSNLKTNTQDFLFDISAHFLAALESPLTLIQDTKKELKTYQILRHNTQTLSQLGAQQKILKKQNQALAFRVKDLETILALKDVSHKNTITVPCYGQHSSLHSGILYVHGGAQTGFQKNLPVMGQGSLIGLVDHVSSQTSRIILLQHDRCRLPIVSHQSNQEGILATDPSGKLVIQFTKDASLFIQGEAIYTSGIDGIIPRGLLIGYIDRISDAKVYVKTAANPQELRYVHISLSELDHLQESDKRP